MEVKTRKKKEEDAFEVYVKQSAEEELFDYVNTNIAKMQRYCNLGNGMPSFYELNEALLNFTDVYCSLISLDVVAKQELHIIKEEFEQWFSEKYFEGRNLLNPLSLSGQKWASSRELEMWVQVNYKSTFRDYKDKVEAAEMKVAFIRRLLEAWDKQSLVLNRLCKNIETEATKLGADVFTN